MTDERTNNFEAIDSIAVELTRHGVEYEVANRGNRDQTLRVVETADVDSGYVVISFINRDDGNSATIKIEGLFRNISNMERTRVLEACNLLNCMSRYAKFYIDCLGGIVVEYDLPEVCAGTNVAEMAYNIYESMSSNLGSWRGVFIKALRTNDSLAIEKYNCHISRWHDKPEEHRKILSCVNDREDEKDCDCEYDSGVTWLDLVREYEDSKNNEPTNDYE
ncbi:MAG: YbjN domain-containing protein [Oscillospiraceae bacterium]|nr:YbjN domain-containing protein [Oscillospiraceae bacterium]